MTTTWHTRALCARPQFRRTNWFPLSSNTRGIEAAKAICQACPVQQACLDDALTEEGGRHPAYRHGIRGGLSPTQRRREYEKRRKDAKKAQREAA